MKKYSLGFFAVVLAVVFSAFTIKERNETTFYYDPPTSGDFSETSVETESNWKEGTTGLTCVSSAKACEIDIPDSHLGAGVGNLFQQNSSIVVEVTPNSGNLPVTDVKINTTSIYNDIRNRSSAQ